MNAYETVNIYVCSRSKHTFLFFLFRGGGRIADSEQWLHNSICLGRHLNDYDSRVQRVSESGLLQQLQCQQYIFFPPSLLPLLFERICTRVRMPEYIRVKMTIICGLSSQIFVVRVRSSRYMHMLA